MSSCVVVSFGSACSVMFWRLSSVVLGFDMFRFVSAVVLSSVKLRYVQFG